MKQVNLGPGVKVTQEDGDILLEGFNERSRIFSTVAVAISTREAEALIPILQRFVETGSIEEKK